MRIHIQSPANDEFAFTPAQWREAAALAGEPPHELSFGTAPEHWHAARDDAEVVVGITSVVHELLPLRAPALRMVFVAAAGVDRLAPFDWLPDHVALVNNSGTHAPKAGEYIAMTVLMLASRMPEMVTTQRAGIWRPAYSAPLAGKSVTIVGTGDLGAAGARTLRALGVQSVGVRTRTEPHPDFARTVAVSDLDAVLPHTDFLVLACPLTPATRGLMDRRRLGLLPRGAGVVNIGRGPLLDGEALCDLLESGHISGAVLDVFDPEPLPEGHRMWTAPNLLITPHVSCDDPGTYNARSLAILFENLRALQSGAEPPNRVDPARGY